MPCGGPSKDFSDEQAEKAFTEIMLLIKEKYYVEEPMFFKEEYRQSKEDLREALKELFWNESAGNF